MKKHINALAIAGGAPAFEDKLHVGRPNIGDREQFLGLVNEMLDRKWLTNNGQFVQTLEKRLAAYLDVKHCVLINNGTIALEIAIKAAELTGEVIVPSFTFVATAHALQWQGITPVFCDVDPMTHTMDPAQVEALITPRTSAIMGVHVWGYPCDVDALTAIAEKHDLALLFDAAHAFSCTYKGRMIGNFGTAEVFSFHATKFYNTLEGGAIATNDDTLAERARFMRNFGFAGFDDVQFIGTNGKMTEICAAMGLVNLDSLPEVVNANHRNYEAYHAHLGGIDGLRVYRYPQDEQQNFQYIIVEVDESVIGVNRDQLVQILQAENVLARRYFYPGCHQMEPYRSYYPHAGLLLPVTEQLTQRVMSLPNGTAVGPDDIAVIADIIRAAINDPQATADLLATKAAS